MKSDKELQQDVLDELKWDPSVDAAQIGVTAKDGIVTISGFVSSFFEKQSAERITKRVAGVKAVANDVEVKVQSASARTDADIAKAALNALKWHSSVPEDRIKVIVSRGWVTLEGDVDWNYQKQSAYQAVENLIGIHGVVNLLTLKPQVQPTEIKRKIKAAFHRSAEFDANNIQIDASDNKVVLHGNVHSLLERQEAESAAWRAPGVTSVKNDICIIA